MNCIYDILNYLLYLLKYQHVNSMTYFIYSITNQLTQLRTFLTHWSNCWLNYLLYLLNDQSGGSTTYFVYSITNLVARLPTFVFQYEEFVSFLLNSWEGWRRKEREREMFFGGLLYIVNVFISADKLVPRTASPQNYVYEEIFDVLSSCLN